MDTQSLSTSLHSAAPIRAEESLTGARSSDELALDAHPLDRSGPVQTCESHGDAAGMAELVACLEAIYLTCEKEQLPRLCFLAERVAAAYQDHFPALFTLASTCGSFHRIMKAHLLMEEALVFPLLRQLDDPALRTRLNHRKLAAFVRAMEMDCGDLLDLLNRINALANSFPTPEESNSMLGVLLRTVHAVEVHSWRRLREEQTILLPRAGVMLEAAQLDGLIAG